MVTRSEMLPRKSHLFTMIAVMIGAMVVVSSAIIYSPYQSPSVEAVATLADRIQLAAMMLMPYMISAVVAAATALGIIAIVPRLRAATTSQEIVASLQELGTGNLSTAVSVRGGQQLTVIAEALNIAAGSLHQQITRLKLVNRQQWAVLCEIRAAAERTDCHAVLRAVETMEKNWQQLATIERQLET